MQALLQTGSVFASKYRIERVLGQGAMGIVLLAHHLHLDERVAIKLPLAAALESHDAVARFLREARAAVKIKSEHVARVSDVGTLETGEPYIVMEYLEGQDLATRLREGGPLALDQAVEFVLQASEALAEAHSLGIVHRDLKPANLFCVRRADGLLAIKVLDFGVSKAAQGAAFDASMTEAGTLLGSPLYMSPEQMLSSHDVDARSDIWAIGVILFETVCGQPPFKADTLIALATMVARAEPPSMRAYRADVPSALEAVIVRCLEKQRAQRYATVADLAQALLPFAPPRARACVERIDRVIRASGLSSTLPSVPPSDATATTGAVRAGAGATLSPLGQTTRPAARARHWLTLGFAALVAATGAAGFWWRRMRADLGLDAPSATAFRPSDAAASRAIPSVVAPVSPVVTPARDPVTLASTVPAPVLVPPQGPQPKRHALPPRLSAAPRPAAPPVARDLPRAAQTSSARPRSACDPNFYFDAQGDKHFKPECFP